MTMLVLFLGDDCDCDTGRLATLQADATAPSLVQPSPWLRSLPCLLCLAQSSRWSINLLKSSNPITSTFTNIPHSTFSSTFAKKRCLVTGLSGCAWRRGEARPGARRPARTHTTGKVCLFLAFFCLFFYFFLFLVFRLFCLFSSAIVSFPGSALRRRRRRNGRLLSKEFFFFCSGLFLAAV